MSRHFRGLRIFHLALECLETKGDIYYIKRGKVSVYSTLVFVPPGIV